MPAAVTPTSLPGVFTVQPVIRGDNRGHFFESWNEADLTAAGIHLRFVQDNQSLSRPKHTLRGLHFQKQPHAQAKLVRCLAGRILDVVVDIRHGSPTFGQHLAVELSAENKLQLLVPAGFAHGFLTLEDDCQVFYKVSDYYAPDCDAGIRWNDPALGIDWGVGEDAVTLSDKDRGLPLLGDLPPIFTYS